MIPKAKKFLIKRSWHTHEVIVSAQDANLLRLHVYHVKNQDGRCYVYRCAPNAQGIEIPLVKDIFGDGGKEAFFINGNTLDYRRSNVAC